MHHALSLLFFQKLRGLVRQKTTNSMPNPMAAMGRAFFSRNHNNNHHVAGGHGNGKLPNGGSNGLLSNGGGVVGLNGGRTSEATLADVFGSKDAGLIPNKHRAFVMDTQVKYTVVSA